MRMNKTITLEENTMQDDKRSHVSASSKSTTRSSTSEAAARARANAEAAKARLKYASKEMELKLQKAHLEASMEMLAIEKEAAAAVAEAEVLEAVTRNSDRLHSGHTPLLSPSLDPVERTREYVKEQNGILKDTQLSPEENVVTTDETEELHNRTTVLPIVHATHLKPTTDLSPTAEAYVPDTPFSQASSKATNPFITREDIIKYYQMEQEKQTKNVSFNVPTDSYSDNKTTDKPQYKKPERESDAYPHSPQQPLSNSNSHMTDFVRFLARRELVTTGLLQFNDQPESYRAWRKSFCNAVRGLDVTCNEEMDLLVKWLGKESSEHAKRIRSIHINHPDLGLQMIWKRLDDCYGSSEVIEKALFQKLDSFPKLNNKDYSKLRDLGDLLMEVNAAKTDGDLPGLSYLDTPRGVNAIVQKLPYGLQERWLIHGSTHKELYQVPFPPFVVFVNFIQHQAQIRNDPSFTIVQADAQKVETHTRQQSRDTYPNVAVHHIHLKRIAHLIPEQDVQAPILLLLGRDAIGLLKVRENINGPPDAPYAQRLDLGWVIVGNVCLGGGHKPSSVNTLFTNALQQGRPTMFEPCSSVLRVKEVNSFKDIRDVKDGDHTRLGQTVFQLTKDDNKPALSIEDRAFLETMKEGLEKNDSNSWVAPLPFRHPRPRLPNNRQLALKRFTSLRLSLQRKPEMKEHFFAFMEKIFENGHAEVAPPLQEHEERWYLPLFGVYHPRKLNNIRVVFDSSAQYEGLSLNDVLLTGPDLNNALVGVLLRFRKEGIAVTADIKQMFHCFHVRDNDRNFLRFFWFKNNDQNQEVIEYRMTVHVFGNSPSPAVAIYCLRQSAAEEMPHDPEVKQFVDRDFYVDDGLKSFPTAEGAISLIKKTQDILANSNLRLHKIASNSKTVMEAFPPEDRAGDLKDLDLGSDTPPLQRSLGLNWDLRTDTFTFEVNTEEKPFTQRGVLSVVNSVYDPLGFAAPVTIQGKHILRELTQGKCEWDSPLPQEMEDKWKSWRDSLQDLRNLQVPRPYTVISPATAERKELCVYCDASTKAIAAVAYLKLTDNTGDIHAGFVMGKSKLAPKPEHTIPRLELCAAVLAVELADLVTSELDLEIDVTTFYTDSTVVLGPSQWKHIPSDQNPADSATRNVLAAQLKDTSWLTGPPSLYKPSQELQDVKLYELIDPNTDPDVRAVSTLKTQTTIKQLGTQRFAKFSSWSSLRHAIARLRHIARSFNTSLTTEKQNCKGWHLCNNACTAENLQISEKIIFRSVQEEAYAEELVCLQQNKKLSRNSPLRCLDPFVDAENILRVGGRIRHGELQSDEKNPVILPGKHHIAVLLVRHFPEQTLHQGRLFTEGAIRAAGYWITGVKKCVSSLLHHCVTCRKLRGNPIIQKMADLPADRLSMEPPFTNVGLDVFGPWSVEARRTRGGLAHSKRWAVIFTCMTVRAVHIEVIESLDTSSFINALKRFLAIRGPVKLIRSDRGTNFIGASAALKIPSNIDVESVEKYLAEKGCSWTFNPPHASHMGGAWERMIGVARRILDQCFLTWDLRNSPMRKQAFHLLLLTTLMSKTFINSNGVKFSIWLRPSGTNGENNISRFYNRGENGKHKNPTWNREVLFYSKISN
ncbi:hypothetical protein WMY93_029149 [Mugilogobius chulae]|uniref:Integrase catalytic domain-containing protein n=1 Tax=Mugilogobius chulae TaxID=88201 RepID=A0AAW0MS75_9GOBI